MYAKRSIRKYSTDNYSSDNDSDSGLNRGMFMSESQNFFTEEEETVRRRFKVEVSVNPSQAIRNPPQNQPQALLPESRKTETAASKPTIISDEILFVPMTIKSKADLNKNSTAPIFTNNLEDTNIWPALNVLDETFTKADGNTSKNHTEIIENLSKQFSYSPRTFTETLLTIIEESFVEPEELSDGFLQFIKMSEGAEFLEEISSPNLVDSQKSGEFTAAVKKSDFHDSGFNSTEYKSFKKLMSPNVKAKTYRRSIRLDIGSETPNKIQRSNEISPIKFGAEKKNYPKSPALTKNRGTPKIGPARRLEVASAKSTGKNPRRRKNFVKPPQIIVYPGTPQSQRKKRRFSTQGSDDEEYLTAESDSEEQTTIQSEESTKFESVHPVASSSRKVNLSSIAYHHQEWVEAYEEISKIKSVTPRRTAMITENKETHTKKIYIGGLRKLREKRQQCLDLIDQLLEKEATVDASVEENSFTTEFFNTLRACSEYFSCGMNVRKACKCTELSFRKVSHLTVNLKKNKKLSPHLSAHRGRTPSPRRSLGKRNVKVKSPGAKNLNLNANSLLKRRSLKGSKSPGVDTTSLRPVSQLRNLFSPGKRAAGFNANLPDAVSRPNAGFGVQEREKTKRKYKHVVSPIALYIKGKKTSEHLN